MKAVRPRFALIVHPADLPLFRAYISYLKPDKTFSDELILKLFEWTPSYKASSWSDITLDGKYFSDGILITVPFLPEMRDISLKSVIKKVEDAISIAASAGCQVAALGAFTSIVLQGKEKEVGQKYGIILTSGNTTTAALIVRSLEILSKQFNRPLSDETVAIIGASGDIGTGVTLWLGNRVKKMILTARNSTTLNRMVQTHRASLLSETEISFDNSYAINKASIAIFVTSAYQAIFTQSDFNPGTIVCDASAPQNISVTGKIMTDRFIYTGGIAQLPCHLDTGFDIGLAATNHMYGCQTEGILMALNPALPPSLGRGNITKDKIDCYMEELDRYQIPPAFSLGKNIFNINALNHLPRVTTIPDLKILQSLTGDLSWTAQQSGQK